MSRKGKETLTWYEFVLPGGAGFVRGGGGVGRAVAGKLASYREVLLGQPPRVVLRPFAFETFGGLEGAAEGLLKRLYGAYGSGQSGCCCP
jgi:hypothetical protein